jgi:hypothetical protein
MWKTLKKWGRRLTGRRRRAPEIIVEQPRDDGETAAPYRRGDRLRRLRPIAPSLTKKSGIPALGDNTFTKAGSTTARSHSKKRQQIQNRRDMLSQKEPYIPRSHSPWSRDLVLDHDARRSVEVEAANKTGLAHGLGSGFRSITPPPPDMNEFQEEYAEQNRLQQHLQWEKNARRDAAAAAAKAVSDPKVRNAAAAAAAEAEAAEAEQFHLEGGRRGKRKSRKKS